jgi:hypothetical protein
MRIRTLVLAAAGLAAVVRPTIAQHDMSAMSPLPPANWSLMLDGRAFMLNNQQQTLHGGAQWGLLDWEMANAARAAGGGVIRFTAMTSLESLILPDSGYHELLQTGEVFNGRRRADVQHPHRGLMELSGAYEHSLMSKLSSSVYAALVGEPALGPTTYMHRRSAELDPFAPIGHHWQDASHESVGVLGAGVASHGITLEGSVFNARESSERHLDEDLRNARLDSYSGRVRLAPAARVALAAWAGYLADHDQLSPGLGMQQYGASLETETSGPNGSSFSNAAIWGMNVHHHSARLHIHDSTSNQRLTHPSSSVLLESTWRVSYRTAIYARAEQAQKMADDFGFLGGDLAQLFTVRTVSVGVTREMAAARGLAIAIGGRAALNLLPATLEPTYQNRTPAGFVMYLTLQPAGLRPGTSMGQMDSSR